MLPRRIRRPPVVAADLGRYGRHEARDANKPREPMALVVRAELLFE